MQLQQAAAPEGGAGPEAAAPAAGGGERADLALAVRAAVRRAQRGAQEIEDRSKRNRRNIFGCVCNIVPFLYQTPH